MLVHCGSGTSLGPQLGTSRLSGRPAFGLTPSEPRGPSLRPLGSFCPSVNSIHSWVFSITALGAVVLSKELLFYLYSYNTFSYNLRTLMNCLLTQVFLTTKLWPTDYGDIETVRAGSNASMQKLQTTYLDLFMMHWPDVASCDQVCRIHSSHISSTIRVS